KDYNPHPPANCTPEVVQIYVTLTPQGLFRLRASGETLILTRNSIRISAENAKVIQRGKDCKFTMVPISFFEWKVSGPAGASPSLGNIDTLTPSFTPALSGQYEVTLTPCAKNCDTAISKKLSLTAVDQLVLPPQTDPEPFASSNTGQGRDSFD